MIPVSQEIGVQYMNILGSCAAVGFKKPVGLMKTAGEEW
jgi:hypothetical protein